VKVVAATTLSILGVSAAICGSNPYSKFGWLVSPKSDTASQGDIRLNLYINTTLIQSSVTFSQIPNTSILAPPKDTLNTKQQSRWIASRK